MTVGPGDGMYNVVDPTDSRWVYNTRELNQMGRMDQKTGVRTNIAPTRPAGPAAAALQLDRADRALAAQPADRLRRRAGAVPLAQPRRHWEEISPDLTTNDPAKIGLNVPYCTITSISESPLKAGTIWVGTDDGKVQLTQNHGGTWTDLTPALVAAGAPADRWVSRVFASPHDAGTAFVSKSGFRNDDFAPYLYQARPTAARRGRRSAATCPNAPINVVVQDRKNTNLLVVGNDVGVFVSIDARRDAGRGSRRTCRRWRCTT